MSVPAVQAGAGLDPAVFGPPGALALQRKWNDDATPYTAFRECPCGATWRGAPGCWACGQT